MHNCEGTALAFQDVPLPIGFALYLFNQTVQIVIALTDEIE